MTIPFGDVPEAERDEQIGFWWKDRLELLVDEKRPKDARALYLEFENDLKKESFESQMKSIKEKLSPNGGKKPFKI